MKKLKPLLKNFIWFEQSFAQTTDPLEEQLEYLKMAIERVFLENDGLESLDDLKQSGDKEYEFSFVYHDDLIIQFVFHIRKKLQGFFISSYPSAKNKNANDKIKHIGFYDDEDEITLEPEKEEEYIEKLVSFMTKSIKTNVNIYENLEENQTSIVDEFVENYKEAFAAKNIKVTEDVYIPKTKASVGVFPFSFRASYRQLKDIEIFGTIETKSPSIEISATVPGVGQFIIARKSYMAKYENMMSKTLEWVTNRTQNMLDQAIAEYIQRPRQ